MEKEYLLGIPPCLAVAGNNMVVLKALSMFRGIPLVLSDHDPWRFPFILSGCEDQYGYCKSAKHGFREISFVLAFTRI